MLSVLSKYKKQAGLILMSGLLILGACNNEPDEGEIVARVGESYLTNEALQHSMLREGYRQDQRNHFIERWVHRELLYQEALRQGLDRSEGLDYELERVKKAYVIDRLVEHTFAEKIKVDDAAVSAYYDKNKELFKVYEDHVHLFHILTDSRETANQARQAILAGESFSKVAETYSIGSFKSRGGDMGFIKEADVIPEIRRVAFRLRTGSLSNVVKSQFGYHVFRVEDKWPKDEIRPLESVRDEIAAQIKASKERQVYFDLLYRLQNSNQTYVASPTRADSLR